MLTKLSFTVDDTEEELARVMMDTTLALGAFRNLLHELRNIRKDRETTEEGMKLVEEICDFIHQEFPESWRG